jgi:hypothetical protein
MTGSRSGPSTVFQFMLSAPHLSWTLFKSGTGSTAVHHYMGGENTSGDASCFLRINKGEGIPWNEVCAKEKDMYGATPTDEAKFS